jgi:tetratricopeptide (TPR) repeat protein
MLCFLAYLPAIQSLFIWDDDYYVVKNLALRNFDGLQRIWIGILPDPHAYPVPQYYPMTLTSFWLEYRAWGLDPTGYHVVNILLHATSAFVLWIILKKLAVPGAWVVAAIFAVHPLQVESVAWVTERKNVLSGLFYLLSLLVYLRFTRLDPTPAGNEERTFALPPERWKVYILALVLFVLALLSKSVTASLPAAVLLILWWKRGKLSLVDDVLPLVPFFALGLAMGFVTSWMEHNVVGAKGPDWDLSFVQRLLMAGGAIWFYAAKLVVPYPLIFFYRKWTIDPHEWYWWLAVVGVIIVVAALWSLRSRIGRAPLVGVLFFIGTLFPALGFISFFPMRYSLVADHFQYLAQIGLLSVIVAALAKWLRPREVAGTMAAIVIAAFIVMSNAHARAFTDRGTLWNDTIAKNPDAWVAHTNVGLFYLDMFEREGDARYLDTAEEQLRMARHMTQHRDPVATMDLGLVAAKRGNYPAAMQYFRESIKEYDQLYAGTNVMPEQAADPHMNLGFFLYNARKLDEAIAEYNTAHRLAPRNVGVMENLADAYNVKGDHDKAIEWANAALDIDPESIKAHNTLANALAAQNRLQEAIGQWNIVLKLDRNNYVALNNIGRVLAVNLGQLDQAEQMFKKALQIKPDFAPAQQNLNAVQKVKQMAATQAATRPATNRATTSTAPAQ